MNKKLKKFHNQDLSKYGFLITGGAGFIGSHIVDYLMHYDAGFVRVLDNLSTGSLDNIKDHLEKNNFEFLQGDIRDIKTCKDSFKKIDFVSHQAALGSVPRSIDDPILTNDVNVSGFLNILNTAKEHKKLKKFVYASSSSVYGDSIESPKIEDITGKLLSPYALSKFINEYYCEIFSDIYRFHSVGLRYFNVFGPNQGANSEYAAVIPLFIKAAMLNEDPVINGDGSITRDFTYVENVVQANIKSFFNTTEKTHIVLNVACGKMNSLSELWNIIKKTFNSKSECTYGPERVGDIKSSLADISLANEKIQYNPEVFLKDGIKLISESIKN